MTKTNHLRSVEEARQDLLSRGISMYEFARDNNLAPHAVYRLLTGRSSNTKYGRMHDAAVVLGIKHGQRRS